MIVEKRKQEKNSRKNKYKIFYVLLSLRFIESFANYDLKIYMQDIYEDIFRK